MLALVTLLPLLSAGCACGRVGTLAARRTLTRGAEVIDVYAFGALLRPRGADSGGTLGWRHATYIYPRAAGDGAEAGTHWTWGWAPLPAEAPFFLATRSLGAEVARYPGIVQAHAGFRMDAFTFAAPHDASRSVQFTYRDDAPEQTFLAMNPLPLTAQP